MSLVAQQIALEAVRSARPLIEAVQRKNAALADQLRRSASSTVLNIAEGARSQGRLELTRYHSAAGSNSETRANLAIAEAWGYISAAQRAPIEAQLDRLAGLLFGLIRRRK